MSGPERKTERAKGIGELRAAVLKKMTTVCCVSGGLFPPLSRYLLSSVLGVVTVGGGGGVGVGGSDHGKNPNRRCLSEETIPKSKCWKVFFFLLRFNSFV